MRLDATYDAAGPAGAPVIVLVHGTRLTRAMWHAQVGHLADEFRVIAVDLPGHGVLADVPFTLEGAAEHLAAVIDEAAAGRAVVVGLSLGGYVGIELAARSPERVAGLVLSGTTQEPVGLRTLPYRGLAVVLARGHRRAFDVVNAWFFRWRFGPEIATPLIGGGFWPAGGARALHALLGRRFIPRLAAYPGPTLILNGSLDVLFRVGEPAFLAAARRASRVVLRGATHLANLDRPEAFSAAVRRFVRGPVAAAEADPGGPAGRSGPGSGVY